MKQKLFNPFLQVAGAKALTIGLLFLVLSTSLAWAFNTYFDGVLDVHYGNPSTLQTHVILNLANVFSLVLVFFLLAAVLTKGKTRLVDIAGTMTLARFPFAILPFLNIGNVSTLIGDKIMRGVLRQMGEHPGQRIPTITTLEYIFLALSTIFLLLVIAWYITLLFNAYKISTNLKGAKLIVSFIAGLIAAEIISSILIYFLA